MEKVIPTLLADRRGATAIEYDLMVAAIATLIIGAVSVVGTALVGAFTSIANAF